MEESPLSPDLGSPDVEAFQRGDWRARSVSAFLFGAVLLAAALGVFGGGPLARASARGDGLRVEFERFARHGRASALKVEIDAAGDDEVTIAVEGGYFTDATFESIFPRPVITTDSGDVQRFTFSARKDEPVVVRFKYLPPPPGAHRGAVRVGGVAVDVSSFVYP